MTLLVIEASAIVDVLAGGPAASAIRAAMATAPELHVPEHFHVEAISALRGMSRRGDLHPERAVRALDLLLQLRVVTHPVAPLAYAVWSLRDTLTAYDAAYLALARQLDAGLVTTDAGLAAAARAEHRLVASGRAG